MHPRAYRYVAKAVQGIDLAGKAVVELGSYNVNGSVRRLFDGCKSYLGVDRRPGPEVDVVSDAAAFGRAASFDVVVSTEMLEHADYPDAIIANVHRILKPGGVFLMTAAGPKRPPHSNDGMALQGGEHYQNIDPADLAGWLEASGFTNYEIHLTPDDEDIRASATKAARGKRTKEAAE